MANLTVIATIKAQPNAEEQVYRELVALLAPTHAEEGCVNYDLHRSLEEPGTFMFYENWTSRALWEQHMQSPHLAAYQQNTQGLVAAFELFLGEMVP
jgi:quinol monooxygenase YgiN